MDAFSLCPFCLPINLVCCLFICLCTLGSEMLKMDLFMSKCVVHINIQRCFSSEEIITNEKKCKVEF